MSEWTQERIDDLRRRLQLRGLIHHPDGAEHGDWLPNETGRRWLYSALDEIERLQQRKRPSPAVERAVSLLRDAWSWNDGAEGDSVRLVCDEVERQRDEIERLRVRVAVLEGAGAVMEEATGTLLAALCNERDEARALAKHLRDRAEWCDECGDARYEHQGHTHEFAPTGCYEHEFGEVVLPWEEE